MNVMTLAIRDAAAVASCIAEARYYLRPDHPMQASLQLILEHAHELAHEIQTIRLALASGPE